MDLGDQSPLCGGGSSPLERSPNSSQSSNNASNNTTVVSFFNEEQSSHFKSNPQHHEDPHFASLYTPPTLSPSYRPDVRSPSMVNHFASGNSVNCLPKVTAPSLNFCSLAAILELLNSRSQAACRSVSRQVAEVFETIANNGLVAVVARLGGSDSTGDNTELESQHNHKRGTLSDVSDEEASSQCPRFEILVSSGGNDDEGTSTSTAMLDNIDSLLPLIEVQETHAVRSQLTSAVEDLQLWLPQQYGHQRPPLSISTLPIQDGNPTSTSKRHILFNSLSKDGDGSVACGPTEVATPFLSNHTLSTLSLSEYVSVVGGAGAIYTSDFNLKKCNWVPASLESANLSRDISLVVSLQQMALKGSNSYVQFDEGSRYILIRDAFCSYLPVKSIEFTDCGRVISIANGFLFGAHCECISFEKLSRLRTVGDDWMAGCLNLKHVSFSGDCESLRSVGDRWLYNCASLEGTDLSSCRWIGTVGNCWLAACDSLISIEVRAFRYLKSVGSRWLNGNVTLQEATLANLPSLQHVDSFWLADCPLLQRVTCVNVSLRAVGSNWLCNCSSIRQLVFISLFSLEAVGAGFLRGCFSPEIILGPKDRALREFIKSAFCRGPGGPVVTCVSRSFNLSSNPLSGSDDL